MVIRMSTEHIAVCTCMQVIKLYAWERPFKQLVEKIRGSELDVLLKAAFLNAATSFTWTCAPFLVSMDGATWNIFLLIKITYYKDSTKSSCCENAVDPDDLLTI